MNLWSIYRCQSFPDNHLTACINEDCLQLNYGIYNAEILCNVFILSEYYATSCWIVALFVPFLPNYQKKLQEFSLSILLSYSFGIAFDVMCLNCYCFREQNVSSFLYTIIILHTLDTQSATDVKTL